MCFANIIVQGILKSFQQLGIIPYLITSVTLTFFEIGPLNYSATSKLVQNKKSPLKKDFLGNLP